MSQPASSRVGAFLEENGTVVMVVGAFAIVLLVSLRGAIADDSWLAFVGGREIVQHGLPSHAQLTLYELQRLGGLRLVVLVHALLGVGSLAAAAVLARRIGGSARSTTWVAIPLMIAYYQIAGALRTQSFAFPLLVAVLWLLVTDARAPSRRVFAPWACVFASPYALGLPGYYHQVLTGGDFSRFVTEWAATTLSISTAPVYLFALGGAWLLGRAGHRATTFEKAAFVLTGVLALQTLRNMAWFALVALVVLPVVFDGVRSPAYEPRRLNRLLATVIAATTVITVVAVAAKPESWFTTKFPSAAADAAAAAAAPDGHVLAMVPYADWLLWSHPELSGRVAFDARFELLSKTQLKRIAAFQAQAEDWKAIARRYRVIVLGARDNRDLRRALVRAGIAHVVRADANVVVLSTS
jgi:hypothetical protein